MWWMLGTLAGCTVLTFALLTVEAVRAERHGLGTEQARDAAEREPH